MDNGLKVAAIITQNVFTINCKFHKNNALAALCLQMELFVFAANHNTYTISRNKAIKYIKVLYNLSKSLVKILRELKINSLKILKCKNSKK